MVEVVLKVFLVDKADADEKVDEFDEVLWRLDNKVHVLVVLVRRRFLLSEVEHLQNRQVWDEEYSFEVRPLLLIRAEEYV